MGYHCPSKVRSLGYTNQELIFYTEMKMTSLKTNGNSYRTLVIISDCAAALLYVTETLAIEMDAKLNDNNR